MTIRRGIGSRSRNEGHYNPMSDNRSPEAKRLVELQEGAYNELRYWHHLQLEQGVKLAEIMRQMHLTDYGYTQFLAGELHPRTVGSSNAHTRAWELRHNSGYPEFVRGLKK